MNNNDETEVVITEIRSDLWNDMDNTALGNQQDMILERLNTLSSLPATNSILTFRSALLQALEDVQYLSNNRQDQLGEYNAIQKNGW